MALFQECLNEFEDLFQSLSESNQLNEIKSNDILISKLKDVIDSISVHLRDGANRTHTDIYNNKFIEKLIFIEYISENKLNDSIFKCLTNIVADCNENREVIYRLLNLKFNNTEFFSEFNYSYDVANQDKPNDDDALTIYQSLIINKFKNKNFNFINLYFIRNFTIDFSKGLEFMVLRQNRKEFNLDYWLSAYLSSEDAVSDVDEVSQNLVISLLDDIVNLIRHEYKDLIFKEKKENEIGKLLGFRPSYQNYGVLLKLNEILKEYLIRIEDEEDLENLEVITNLNIIYVNYLIEAKASSIQEGNEESNLYLILNKFYEYIGIIFENIRDGNVINESMQVSYIDLINKYFNLVVNISSYQDFDNTKYLHEFGVLCQTKS
ncbi:unnamed protein product [[Candida] boidinii]|nr:unnamed protein product [[Candida] boidinii]